jgi:hypothetical protein
VTEKHWWPDFSGLTVKSTRTLKPSLWAVIFGPLATSIFNHLGEDGADVETLRT